MRDREMVQQVRADLALAEDPGSVTSIYITAENYFYRQIICFFYHLQTLHKHGSHTYIGKTNTTKIKISKSKKKAWERLLNTEDDELEYTRCWIQLLA